MKRVLCSLAVVATFVFTPIGAGAEDAQEAAYTRIYALADDSHRKDVLTPSQAKELKGKLQQQINTFNSYADEKYVFPDEKVLAVLDTPYDLFDATRLNGWFEGANRYANAAGPGMSGKLGSREKYKGYWESLSMDHYVWTRHVRALVNAYENAAGTTTKKKEELVADLDSKNFDRIGEAGRSLVSDTELFLKRLKDPNADVRYKTVWGLWEIVIPHFYAYKFKDDVIPLLSDPDPRVRAEAIGFFGVMRDSLRQDQIAGLLKDSDEKVRRNAIIYLDWMKATKYQPQIEALLSDSNESVRKTAEDALKSLKGSLRP